MNHAQFVAEVLRTPWALADFAYDAIARLLAAPPTMLTPELVRAQIGAPEKHAEPYLVSAEGERFPFQAAAVGGKNGKLIAVIPIEGVITNGAGDSWWGTTTGKLSRQIREAVANADVKSIVLDCDSPGGSVYGVDELAAEIYAAGQQKKIVTQVNPLCASAAYYLGSQAGEVVIMPSGEVGSIGVRMMWVGYADYLKQAGIEVQHIFSGKYKVEGNPFEALGEEARAFFQKRCDEYYEPFVKAVARGRGVKSADVRTGFGEGRVVGAADAKSLGLVDRVATLEQTIGRLGGDMQSATPAASSPGSRRADSGDECTCECQPCRDANCAGCDHEECECAGCTCDQAEEPEEQASATSVPTAEADQQEVLTMSTVATPAAAAANLEQLRAQYAAEAERIESLTALAREHNMTDKLSGWIKDGATVATAQGEVLTQLRTSARPIQTAAGDGSGIQVVKDVEDKTHASVRVARMARLLASTKGDKRAAAQRAELLGDKVVASAFMAAAPQNASNLSQGGAFIPENWVPDLIEFLRPEAVFRALNPVAYPLVNGTLSLPKLSAGGTASYVGELGPIPSSQAKAATVKGAAKKLAALIPISNDLVRYAGLSVDAALRDDMMAAIGQAEDGAFIRAQGSQYTPKGLLYQATAASKVASSILKAKIDAPDSTTSVLTAVQNDLSNMLKRCANSNVRFRRMGWLLSRRSEIFLKYQVRDGIGNQVFRAEMENGKLMGFPYKATTVVPNNLGTSTYDSEIYLADFADIIIADAPTIAIEVSNEASYVDADGVTHNSFQEDSTLIRFIEEHDLMVRHEESIQVLTTVQYGA